MELFILEDDIKVFCVTADSFPNGIVPAFEKLRLLFAQPSERTYYGISKYNDKGELIYKAATAETYACEAEALGCETFLIPKGTYISTIVKDFRSNMAAIGQAFMGFIGYPGVDQMDYCIECYLNNADVRCMIKLQEK